MTASLDIVMADGGVPFDGRTWLDQPLGGAEGAFCDLAEALAARGHHVTALTRTDRSVEHAGVTWRPLADGAPDSADLYIANRGSKLIGLVPEARRRLLWLHNPAHFLNKPKFIWPLLRWRPTLVVLGAYHASTLPRWIPHRKAAVIPHGVGTTFWRRSARTSAPPPCAIVTSNPERGLSWLVDLWIARVLPQVPEAELHVYSGAATYAGHHAQRLQETLSKAKETAKQSVIFHDPVPRHALAEALADARLMPYRGDPGETFCLAAAEAQAMGVPLVTQPIGSLPERVVDGETGFVTFDDQSFAEACVRLLCDDELWHAQHRAALADANRRSWDDTAADFEALAQTA